MLFTLYLKPGILLFLTTFEKIEGVAYGKSVAAEERPTACNGSVNRNSDPQSSYNSDSKMQSTLSLPRIALSKLDVPILYSPQLGSLKEVSSKVDLPSSDSVNIYFQKSGLPKLHLTKIKFLKLHAPLKLGSLSNDLDKTDENNLFLPKIMLPKLSSPAKNSSKLEPQSDMSQITLPNLNTKRLYSSQLDLPRLDFPELSSQKASPKLNPPKPIVYLTFHSEDSTHSQPKQQTLFTRTPEKNKPSKPKQTHGIVKTLNSVQCRTEMQKSKPSYGRRLTSRPSNKQPPQTPAKIEELQRLVKSQQASSSGGGTTSQWELDVLSSSSTGSGSTGSGSSRSSPRIARPQAGQKRKVDHLFDESEDDEDEKGGSTSHDEDHINTTLVIMFKKLSSADSPSKRRKP